MNKHTDKYSPVNKKFLSGYVLMRFVMDIDKYDFNVNKNTTSKQNTYFLNCLIMSKIYQNNVYHTYKKRYKCNVSLTETYCT